MLRMVQSISGSLQTIDARGFANCANLAAIHIPVCGKLVIYCHSGNEAHIQKEKQ